MSAFYNHAVQGGAIHALPFMFINNRTIQLVAFVSGFVFGIMPDVLKILGIEVNHKGKLNSFFKYVPAWGFHTELIDYFYHVTFESKSWQLNWLETYLTLISAFIIIHFAKLFI